MLAEERYNEILRLVNEKKTVTALQRLSRLSNPCLQFS